MLLHKMDRMMYCSMSEQQIAQQHFQESIYFRNTDQQNVFVQYMKDRHFYSHYQDMARFA